MILRYEKQPPQVWVSNVRKLLNKEEMKEYDASIQLVEEISPPNLKTQHKCARIKRNIWTHKFLFHIYNIRKVTKLTTWI